MGGGGRRGGTELTWWFVRVFLLMIRRPPRATPFPTRRSSDLFREGEDTAAELIEARNRRSQVQLQRAAAAYQYDLTLAGLLLASGQGEHFDDYLRRADRENVQ